jgi:hypothetical protein
MDSHKANARIWHMIVRWCIDGILSLRRGFAQILNALVASQNKPRFGTPKIKNGLFMV